MSSSKSNYIERRFRVRIHTQPGSNRIRVLFRDGQYLMFNPENTSWYNSRLVLLKLDELRQYISIPELELLQAGLGRFCNERAAAFAAVRSRVNSVSEHSSNRSWTNNTKTNGVIMKDCRHHHVVCELAIRVKKSAEAAHDHACALNSYILQCDPMYAGSAALIREAAALLAHQAQHFETQIQNEASNSKKH